MKVGELQPGDRVGVASVGSAVFIAAAPHPTYHGLALVCWADAPPYGGLSFDALDWKQDVGEVAEGNGNDRGQRLLNVLGEL